MSEIPVLSEKTIKQAAGEAVGAGVDIRTRVRDLTVAALQSRRLDREGVREVVRAVIAGIGLGLEKPAGDTKAAVREALAGLDQALQASAEAAHLTLQQMSSHAQDFSAGEWQTAVDRLKQLEEEFLATARQAAEIAGTKAKGELIEAIRHLQRTGTDTGARVAAILVSLANRLTMLGDDARHSGSEAAREAANRLAALASGILAGMSDALHQKKD